MGFRVTAVLGVAMAVAILAACAGTHDADGFVNATNSKSDAGSKKPVAGPDGGGKDGSGGGGGGGGDGGGGDGGGTNLEDVGGGGGTDGAEPGPLGFNVQPSSPILDVMTPGPVGMLQFQAVLNGAPTSATWSIDSPALGAVDPTGLFTASGTVAGTANVTAIAGGYSSTAHLTVKLDTTENAGGVVPATQMLLQAGGTADSNFGWLYPYNKTVFPRGLTPPILQFGGVAPDAMLIHITAPEFDYQTYVAGSNPGSAMLSADAWQLITSSVTGNEAVTVQATKISGGQVSGPITETWTIAQGSLKGTVYYNSYDSMLAGDTNGAVLQMKPGTPASLLVGGGSSSTNCVVCHAVSADGSTLVAAGPGDSTSAYQKGAAYLLTPTAGGTNASSLYTSSNSSYGFGGLYPDGSLMLTCAAMAGGWTSNGPNIPGLGNVGTPVGDRPSVLMVPKTGSAIPAPGFDGVVKHALMPAFSPDGSKVAFNHYDTGQGHSLAVMDFTKSTNTFSGLLDVATNSSSYLSWPAFLPNSGAVVYNTVNYGDYATWNNYTQEPNHAGDLQMVDLATMTVTPLDAANGISSGQVYLPYGAAEAHLNFEPTVLPVAVGGYYWVIFTSRREYGNLITDANAFEVRPGRRKKLWVTAIDVNPTPGIDPSHPAFYINDQELQAGNMRAFWALDPCQANGTSCGSGDQCCSGYCEDNSTADPSADAGPGRATGRSCVPMLPPTTTCAQEYDKCAANSDCCGASQGYQCINGFCAEPPPPPGNQ